MNLVRKHLLHLLCLILLVSCTTGSPPGVSTPVPPQNTPTAQITPPAGQPILPSPTVQDEPEQPETTEEPDQAQPVNENALASGDAPLRFTLPTPGPAPKSLWRPPLYDVPWALGQFDHFFFSRPIAADVVNWPEADYRYGGTFFGANIVHTGVDIAGPLHNPVIAAGDGRVVWAGYGLYMGNNDPKDPYGMAVTIRHNFGYKGTRIYTVYAHMDRIDVVTGQDVKTGDQLGIIGTTGNTTGPHLHFEVRMESNSFYTTYNPELWMVPPQGWGVLVGRMMNTNGSLLDQQMVYVRNKDSGQLWSVRSYGQVAVNSDPYYQENLVLSDLPAGTYEVYLDYLDKHYGTDITIHPGAVSYFTFRGARGFRLDPPPLPDKEDLLEKIVP